MRISVWSHRAPNQRRSPEIARDLLRRAVAEHVRRDVPVLHRPGRAPAVRDVAVSLSRSDDVAMCVVADSGAVGIDVERLRPWEDLADMASLIGYAVPRDAPGLLALWTCKEALAKALGTGLPDDVRTLETPQDPPEAKTWARSNGWLWVGCPCEAGCVAALVVASAGPDGHGTVDITELRQSDADLRAWTMTPRL